jgi:hypothetical protein
MPRKARSKSPAAKKGKSPVAKKGKKGQLTESPV